MQNELLAQNAASHLIVPGDHIICAISGGADSMALLWCLHLLQDTLQITLSALHCNHHLRGKESDEDAAFVQQFCDLHAISLQCFDLDVPERQKQTGESSEEAARSLRYACFAAAVPQQAKIATAHTADDNLETTLIHLVRGTSPRGLSGIPSQRDRMIRPLLFATRRQILDFLERHHIPHREDATNQTDFCLRNRLRHHVVPQLLAENQQLSTAWLDTARQLREEDVYLSQLAKEAMAQVRQGRGFSIPKVFALPTVLQRRVLFGYLEQFGLVRPQRKHVDLLLQLMQSSCPSGRLNFPGCNVLRSYGCMMPQSPAEPQSFSPIVLPIPGRIRINELGLVITCEQLKNFTKIENTATTFTIKYAMIEQGQIYIRPRRTGDEITLPGGTRSLKRLFIDRKIPARHRPLLPVFADSRAVIAVGFIGVNQTYAADGTAPCLRIKIEKEEDHHAQGHTEGFTVASTD